jgi:hypothetical protein
VSNCPPKIIFALVSVCILHIAPLTSLVLSHGRYSDINGAKTARQPTLLSQVCLEPKIDDRSRLTQGEDKISQIEKNWATLSSHLNPSVGSSYSCNLLLSAGGRAVPRGIQCGTYCIGSDAAMYKGINLPASL